MRLGMTSVLRRYCVGICALTLAACNAPQDSALESGISYRDQSAAIGVTSRFDEAKFQGLWYVRSFLPEDEAFDIIALTNEPTGPQMQIVAFVCDPAGVCGNFAKKIELRREGDGRYVFYGPEGRDRRMWVLWVDEGFRTAVVGNPEGTFAWILDRSEKGGADRIKAAREILDFNGYDVSQLKVKK